MEQALRRRVLLKIISSIRYLARQSLALRGHNNDEEGNLYQLMKHRGEDDEEILEWLKKKSSKSLTTESQNELIRIMALHVLRQLTAKFHKSPFITIMIDETTDITNQEQVVVVLRTVGENFSIEEDLVGLYSVSRIDATTLVTVIKDTLIRLNLPVNKLRGQCYDGCSTMSGHRSGVAKQIRDEEARAVYTHCYSHSLSLAASDTIKKSKLMKSALEITHEITKLIKLSPRREAIFKALKEEEEMASSDPSGGSIKLLCPTRWTVRADSLLSIIENYSELLNTWEQAKEAARDTESKARILGVESQMKTFNFLFGTYLGELILRHTDNLSKTLQDKHCSAAEGQMVAEMVTKTLHSIRSENCFDLFWQKVLKTAELYDIEPQLPRKRKTPRRYEEGNAAPEFHDDPKALFRQQYYEAVDLAVNCIEERFKQPGYEVYKNLEQLLLKSCKGEDAATEFDFVCCFYKNDVDPEVLQVQLLTFGLQFRRVVTNTALVHIRDIKDYFCSLTSSHRLLLSQVCVLVQLILVMPATNATSERAFSTLRRLKTYLRNTMTQQRLNHLMLLNVHKNITDCLNLTEVATEFIGDSEHRLKQFGSF